MIARRRNDRIFARALVLSLLIHLSAVTVFRIVFHFPRKDVDYFDVSIVATPMMPMAAMAAAPDAGLPTDRLSVAGPDATAAAAEPAPVLPAIDPPAVKFEGLEKLRLRQEALASRSRFEEYFAGDANPDGDVLGGIGQTLSRLTFGAPEERGPAPVSRPAPGFEAYIEWLSPPTDRKVLQVAPIDALWGVAPDDLAEPITLAFRVYRDGRVDRTGVITLSGFGDTVKAAANALGRYRFEPLLGDGPETQSGTFVVRAAKVEP